MRDIVLSNVGKGINKNMESCEKDIVKSTTKDRG